VPEHVPLAIYIDSNVVISACLDEHAKFLKFWRLHNVEATVSRYALDEIARNLPHPSQRSRLSTLLAKTRIVSDADNRLIPSYVRLVEKDRPILAAAIAASLDYLVTGDKNHFAHLYGTAVSGVQIISPSDFLSIYEDRLPE